MKFFFDENMSPKLITFFRDTFPKSIGDTYIRLTDIYSLGTKDHEWIDKISKIDSKPIVVTFDNNILTNPINKNALIESGLSFVFFPSELNMEEHHAKLWCIFTAWPSIRTMLEVNERLILRVHKIRKPRKINIDIINSSQLAS